MDFFQSTVLNFVLSAALFMRIFFVDAGSFDNLTITPKDPYIENGTTLELYCQLNLYLQQTRTASELKWYQLSQDSTQFLSESFITTLNNSVSELHLVPDLGDMTYYCAFDDNLNQYDASVVHVGFKPVEVSNLECHSRNIISYWCQWDNLRLPYHFATTTVFQYGLPRHEWRDCPAVLPEMRKTSCMVSKYNDDTYNNVNYNVRVIASNPLGSATSSLIFHPSFNVVPYPPESLSGEALDGYNLNVTWGLPQTWESHYELNCEVSYRRKVNPTEPKLDRNKITFYQCNKLLTQGFIEDLHPYTTYEVSVRAKYVFTMGTDPDTWSRWSLDIEMQTLEDAPSGAVTEFKKRFTINDLPDRSRREVYFTWNEVPEEQCNGLILGYNIYVIQDDEPLTIPTYNVSASNRFIYIIVDKFETFRVYVLAYNSAGEGTRSKPVDIFDMTSIPGHPFNPRATPLSYASILVQWEEPANLHGNILFYLVDWKKTLEDEEWNTNVVDGDKYRLVIDGLEPFTNYEFRIQANNSAGLGAWTENTQAKTHESEPYSFPQDITLTNVTDKPTQLLLTWRPPLRADIRGKIIHYNIYFCEKDVEMNTIHNISDEIQCDDIQFVNYTDIFKDEDSQSFYRYTLTDLEIFTEYLLWMSASNSAGEGIMSHRLSVRTEEGVPAPPDLPVLDSRSAFAVSLNWSVPIQPNGIVTKYIVRYSNSHELFYKHVSLANAKLTDGIYGDVEYAIAISACNGHLCGLYSEILKVTTLIGAPESVSVFEISLIASDKVYLSWLPPLHPNGPISHYVIHYGPGNQTHSLWKYRTVQGLSTTIQVECTSDAAFFTYNIIAVTMDGFHEIVGESIAKKYEMCQKFPVPIIIMAVLIPGLILMMGVACFYIIKLKKAKIFQPFPEPRFNEDFMIKPWDAPLKPEKEHFDKLRTLNDRYTAPPNIMQERSISKASSGIDSDQGFDEMEVMVGIPSEKNGKTTMRSSSSSQGIGRSIVGTDLNRDEVAEDFEDDAVFDHPGDVVCRETAFNNEYYPVITNSHLMLDNSEVRRGMLDGQPCNGLPGANSYAMLSVANGPGETEEDYAPGSFQRKGSLGSNGSVEYHTMSINGLVPISLSKDNLSEFTGMPPDNAKSFSKDYECVSQKDLSPIVSATSMDDSSTTSDYPASPDSFNYGLLGHAPATGPLSPLAVSIPPDTDNCTEQALLLAGDKDVSQSNVRHGVDVSGDYVCSLNSLTDKEEQNENIDPYTVIPIGSGSPPYSYNSTPYSQLSIRPSEVREGSLSDGITECNYSRIPECHAPLTPPAGVTSPFGLRMLGKQEAPAANVIDRTGGAGQIAVFEVPDSGIDSDHSNGSMGVETHRDTDNGHLVSLPITLAGNTVMQRPRPPMDVVPLIIDDLFAPASNRNEETVIAEDFTSSISPQTSVEIPHTSRSDLNNGGYVVSPVL